MRRSSLALLLYVTGIPASLAYNQPTHRDLTEAATVRSELSSDSFREDFGLPSALPLDEVRDLLGKGAWDEDEPARRSLSHFFDVQNSGRGLYVGSPWFPLLPQAASPDWILAGAGQSFGEFSYRQATALFLDALTSPTSAERDSHWTGLFLNLGHVVHHIQDMAQPEHVRNDPHVNFSGDVDLFGEGLYELYTEGDVARAVWNRESLLGRDAPVRLMKARYYWSVPDGVESEVIGLAEFTSVNFVSKDTNFGYSDGEAVPSDLPLPRPPVPLANALSSETLASLGISNADAICARLLAHPNIQARGEQCKIDFVRLPVFNTRPFESPVNPRAVSLSIFDQYIGTDYFSLFPGRDAPMPIDRMFTLNRFNFDAAYAYLIPRAVSYSAGLINYFFRGRLKFLGYSVAGGRLSLQFENASGAQMSFSNGAFHLYYDDVTGIRKELDLADGRTVGGAGLAPGAVHTITAPLPTDVDLLVSKPFMLVFDGIVGEERGIAGLAFEGPDVGHGIVFSANQAIGGEMGSRLVSRVEGLWVLHPQTGFGTVGDEIVDWKGHYVDGKPTRVLTWAGKRYRAGGATGYRIYQGGKLLAVAPARVMGAAIQKDARGKDWLIVVCNDGVRDVVYRRPAIPSNSATGWQQVGQAFDNPSHLENKPRPWLFNGSGTEAQTTRELNRNFTGPNLPRSMHRLKVVVGSDSAAFADLGNTFIRQVDYSERMSDCESPASGTRIDSGTSSLTGSTVVAVDYIDGQEVVAEIVADSSYDSRAVTSGVRSGSRITRVSERWTLRGPGFAFAIRQGRTETSWEADGSTGRHGYTTNVDETLILALDLRYALLVGRTAHEEIDSTAHGPLDGVLEGRTIATTHNDYFVAETSVGRFDRKAIDQAFSLQAPEENYYYCEGSGPPRHSESDYTLASLERQNVTPLKIPTGTVVASAASDVDGNSLISLRIGDVNGGSWSHHNYLTGGNLADLLHADVSRLFLSNVGAQ